MRKRNLILSMALSTTMLITPMAVFAGEEIPVERNLEIQAALQQLEFQMVEVAPGIEAQVVTTASAQNLAVVRNYSELVNALNVDFYDGAFVVYDIEMEDTLEIRKDFAFEGLVDGMKLFSARDKRHFTITQNEVDVDLGNVVLDGGLHGSNSSGIWVASGGIEVGVPCSITGGTIQNCHTIMGISHYGGAIQVKQTESFTLADCRLLDNYGGLGGGLYAEDSDITVDGCEFNGNAAAFGGGIWFEGNITVRNSILTENNANGAAIFNGTIALRSLADSAAKGKLEICDTAIYNNGGSIAAVKVDTRYVDVQFSNVYLGGNTTDNIVLDGSTYYD